MNDSSTATPGKFGGEEKEIDPGYYVLYQDDVVVARIWVSQQADEEYWELFRDAGSTYKYPSSVNTSTQSTNITMKFVYQGDITLDEFKAAKRETSNLIHLVVVAPEE